MIDSFFANRCTIREFSSQDVPDDLINEILAGAIHAPNTGNMQWYSVIITKNNDIKSRLAACHFNQPAAVNAKLFATFCLDINRFQKWCCQRDAIPGFSNFQSLVAGIIDTSIFAQQFATVAELKGLGTCVLGTTTYNAPEIDEILNLPPMVVPVTTLALGFRTADMVPTERLDVEAVMHSEVYHDYTPIDIDRIYFDKEHDAANQKFVEENRKETLAQVFTDVRYPKANNEIFSDKFLSYIERKGFILSK